MRNPIMGALKTNPQATLNVIKEASSPKKKANYVRNSSAVRSDDKRHRSSIKLESALKVKLNNLVAKKIVKTEKQAFEDFIKLIEKRKE